MTLKECDAAARMLVDVLHRDVVYRRIVEVGYDYDAAGNPRPFVTLEDKNRHSQTRADPRDVMVIDDEGGTDQWRKGANG